MSRARDWTHPETGQLHWFDVHSMATDGQLELLADVEGLDIDDLIDSNLSSREVLYRLNQFSNLIPSEVLERKRARRELSRIVPVCRLKGDDCEGRMTRHHFIPRWAMLALENYGRYSPRSYCTIPLCMHHHRYFHIRDDQDKSIASLLSDEERKLAGHLLRSLKRERPAIYELMAGGEGTYEYQLVRDFQLGHFRQRDSQSGMARSAAASEG